MPLVRVTRPAIAVATGLALAAVTAGCEDRQHVMRRAFVTPQHLMTMQATGGLLVERHGLPWPGATPEETIATLRMPAGPAAELHFSEIRPGEPVIGTGERLVLLFNPLEVPSVAAICDLRREIPTGPGGGGFLVSATYCDGRNWVVYAETRMDDVNAKDWLGYVLAFRELFTAMFPEH